MKNGANKDYKFGAKNNWRRWKWNRIAERLSIPANQARVLYMGGKDDLDRKVMIERGFLSNNLYLVERELQIAKSLRKKSKVVIVGDLFDVLMSSSFGEFDVIDMDWTSGYSIRMRAAIYRSTLVCKFGGVVSANILRGRESFWSVLNNALNGYTMGLKENVYTFLPEMLGELFFDFDHQKHRGYAALLDRLVTRLQVARETIHEFTGKWIDDATSAQFLCKDILDTRPQFMSYKSNYEKSCNVFDSIIFTNKFDQFCMTADIRNGLDNEIRDELFGHKKFKDMRNEVAAARAVATMRRNGTLIRQTNE